MMYTQAAVDASVIYISTDYVFDGKNPPFKVTDPPNPLNKYGKASLKGKRQLLEKKIEGEDISGIFHWSGDEMMTKYDMAVAMAEAFGIPKGHIKADKNPSGGAPRPYDAHLDSSRVESLGICKRSKFKDRIRPALERFYP
nr:hypothetical protein BaRGS_004557 [Batillaria attramentaria]